MSTAVLSVTLRLRAKPYLKWQERSTAEARAGPQGGYRLLLPGDPQRRGSSTRKALKLCHHRGGQALGDGFLSPLLLL